VQKSKPEEKIKNKIKDNKKQTNHFHLPNRYINYKFPLIAIYYTSDLFAVKARV
jgi:hypothetical protein